ncbi:MAG: cell division protein FtsA [Bacteroidota bacterium]|jgi:cell division protein FtsA|uniref:cell division protein FtsA n=1 Tax=Candidatus Pollutiaquabacter sp. TaxID=3416354 RepID=UPI001A592ADC|nr:cell division protein FtsA [Bacteroidota bacterium]MBL7947573.1 cell division protein FtsA [Bacteroidia bacterium]MBP7270011.1 cell division protein FtsA [Bacteroidia bacterium]MBP7437930.1 cell division protein FtsA [Bacteroidia bacterium]MBP7728260.1 cell division protein FtsA [Bacteroidia bacterium]
MENEIVVGLDIGTTKICTIVGRRNEFGKIDILGYGKSESLGVTRGVVTNIVNTIASIKKSIEEASGRSDVDIHNVFVGIAGQHIKSLQHHGMRTRSSSDDEITQADIDAIVADMYKLAMPPGEEIIHVIPQEYIVDNEIGIKNPIGMSGVRLEANCHIITGQVTAAKNIYKCVKRAGLTTEGLFLEPLASSEAVLTEEEKEAGVVLVDIGGGTTDIAIFQDGVIRHTAVIPFGGNVITEDIKEGCAILKNQAELLKVKFGSALADKNQENEIVSIPGLRGREPKEISLKNLASIIQARMEEIIELVYQEIRSSGYEKKLIGGIVITGGGAQLKHIVQLVEYLTGMDTRIGYPNEHLAKGADELKSPMYATGVGLVIKGFHELERKRQSQLASQQTVTETGARNMAGKSAKEDKARVAQPTEDNNKRGFIKSILEKIFDEDDSDQPLT